MKTYVYLWQYLAEFCLECEIFQAEVAEKTKTYILCSIKFFFFWKLYRYETMWKNKVEPDRPQMTV
jgi:hypothetical protein